MEERDPEVTEVPVRRGGRTRRPPPIPAEPAFDRPEEDKARRAAKPKTAARRRKPRPKRSTPSRGGAELQPRVHRGGKHVNTA
jgi:hypothetical protein